jgi:serine protease Do
VRNWRREVIIKELIRSDKECRNMKPVSPVRAAALLLSLFLLILWTLPPDSCGAETPTRKKGAVDLSTAIVQVAKQTIPAVVHIEVTERQEMSAPMLPFEGDPFFRYFFGNPRTPRKFRREVKGVGTGMLIDAQGHILTNHHVAGGASKLEAVLADGRKFPARLIGSDPKTDLAVIKILAKEPLPYVTFGDSDKTEVGEWVIAIGHPRGLDQTVTQGIISAKHRRGITDPSGYQDFLQTDAAINPGNSGGPLLNLSGEVIGVNAAIASQSGGSEGIGFAIPSNIALHISKILLTKGKVERGWLGVSVQDVPAGQTTTRGALIAEVMKGGPAEKGGLRKGDIVVNYDGKNIPDGASLRNEAGVTPVGRDVKVTVLREGQKQVLTLKVGSPQEAAKLLGASVKERLGAEFRALTEKEAQRFGLESGQGLAISSVDPKGPMGKAGFEVGDLILEVNGQAIGSIEELTQIAATLKPKQQITVTGVDHRTGNGGRVQIVVR